MKESSFQKLPIRTELGKKLQEKLLPEPGTILVDINYSSIELRLAALIQNLDISDKL